MATNQSDDSDDIRRAASAFADGETHPKTDTHPPLFNDLSADTDGVEITIDGPDMLVQYDDWEFYLGEANGPCRPSIQDHDMIRFYGHTAVVFIERPGRASHEVKFTLRNAYPIDGDGDPIRE